LGRLLHTFGLAFRPKALLCFQRGACGILLLRVDILEVNILVVICCSRRKFLSFIVQNDRVCEEGMMAEIKTKHLKVEA
jgi:hypothetical protein